MAQLNFEYNLNAGDNVGSRAYSNGTLSFIPINIRDSISWSVLNFQYVSNSSANMTHTLSVGLYSLNGSTLSLANSISGSFSASQSAKAFWVSLTATSATLNITPGTWWIGLLVSTGGNSAANLVGGFTNNPQNAFPGGFIQGRMTDSTNALPTAYSTSNLDITGSDAMFTPYILLTT